MQFKPSRDRLVFDSTVIVCATVKLPGVMACFIQMAGPASGHTTTTNLPNTSMHSAVHAPAAFRFLARYRSRAAATASSRLIFGAGLGWSASSSSLARPSTAFLDGGTASAAEGELARGACAPGGDMRSSWTGSGAFSARAEMVACCSGSWPAVDGPLLAAGLCRGGLSALG